MWYFFFSSRRRHTRFDCDWSSDVCSSDLVAQEKKVARGQRLRVDTTVVERNIHYPTDSGLLGDGARVLTRTMKKITELTGRAGTKLRNRMRTIGHRVMEIARTSRSKGPQVQERLKQGYRKLLTTTRKVVNQA